MSEPTKEPPWMPEWLARLAMASGVGYVAAAWTVSRWLTRPTFGAPTRTPSDFRLAWEPLECRTADAIRLVGWVVAGRCPRATVALFHGVRQKREQTLERIAFLTAAGYRCVAFDHRAHGESGGNRTSFGFRESLDVAAVLDLVRRRWPAQPRAALGISMGGAALCYAAVHARTLDAVILESVYRDIASAFVSRIGSGYPAWFQRLTHGVIWVTERRLGLRLEQLSPVQHMADLAPAPVLIVTGAEDPHAPPVDAQALHSRCIGPRQLLLVPGAGHRDVLQVGGEIYRQHILEFLDRSLSAAPTTSRSRSA